MIIILFIAIFLPVFILSSKDTSFFPTLAFSSHEICFFSPMLTLNGRYLALKIALKINNVIFSVLFREIVVPLQIGIKNSNNQQ